MKKRMLQLLPLTLLLVLMLSTQAFAKSAIMPGFKISEKKGSAGWNYDINTGIDATAKLGNGTASLSATILLPKALFAKKNVIWVGSSLNLHDPSITNGDDFVGTVPGLCNLKIMVNKKGKITIERYNGKDGQKLKLGKVAKVKKTKKFYVLTLNKLPYDKIYFQAGDDWAVENEKPLNRNKTYAYSFNVSIFSNEEKLAKKVNGFMYVDKLTVNCSKKISLSVPNWNFKWLECWRNFNGRGTRTKAKLAVIKY